MAAPVGILTNLVAVPLAALAVPAIGITLLAGTAAFALGRFLAGGTGLILDGLDVVARAAAAIPGGHALVPADQAVAWTLAAIAAGAVAAASARRPEARARPGRRERRRLRPRAMALGTALALLLLWPVALRVAGAGSMDIWAIDVGQGDALAIRSPAGRWLLVDAGPRDERFDAGKARVVPFLLAHGVRRLEALVLTHPDADHIGGAPAVLDAIPVAAVLEPGVPAGRPLYLEALRTARRRGTRWLAARDGRELRLDGMLLRVLSPRPESLDGAVEVNEVSVVFSLEYGSFRALFMGDAPTDAEAALVADHPGTLLRAALIKIGHHGSATSTGDALLEAAEPRGALISVGRHNRFGHPTPATLHRLARRGIRVWRTDVAGTLHVRAVAAGGWRVETAR
jgi:competence protein ComEC